jgi:hypothetical protein
MSKDALAEQRFNSRVNTALNAVFEAVGDEMNENGPDKAHELVRHFLSGFTATLIHSALTAHNDNVELTTKEERTVACVLQVRKSTKTIEESIAEGFTLAYQTWANIEPEFEVKVRALDTGVQTKPSC